MRLGHRLIALTFLGSQPSPLHTDVAHNDGNKLNNQVTNLRWALHRDNQMDMRKHGTMQDGIKSVTCKITPEIALEIRSRVASGKRGIQIRISKEKGLSKAQVCRIANGTRWAYLDQKTKS